MGWGGFITDVEPTLPIAGWNTGYDVTTWGIPSDATGVILYGHSSSAAPRRINARATGSTDPASSPDMGLNGGVQMFVRVGDNSEIDLNAEEPGAAIMRVVGYFGDEAYFLDNPVILTLDAGGTGTTPTTIDISSYLQGVDVAAAAIVRCRAPNGDFDERIIAKSTAETGMDNAGVIQQQQYQIVPIESDSEFDVYRSSTAGACDLVGYIKTNSGWTFYAPASEIELTRDNAYHDFAAAAGYTKALYQVDYSTAAATYAHIRKNGSSQPHEDMKPGGSGCDGVITELDGSGIAEYWSTTSAVATYAYLVGLWVEPSSSLYEGTIDQSPTGIDKNTYVKIATVAPTDDTLTVTISAAGSVGSDVVVADNVGITLVE